MNESFWRAWVAAETGATVRSFERAGTGASRATFLVELEPGSPSDSVVLRVDSGDGPLSGTPLDLNREAKVYRALRDTNVRIPRLLAVHPSGAALLMQRAAGSDGFALAEASARPIIARNYLKALGDLHRVEGDALAAAGFEPARADSAAHDDVLLWRGILDDRGDGADPLWGWAGDWLDSHVPADPTPARLCHGDAGPGNFLFEGTEVTALLDWEFAHLGDPMDDLAWVAIRSHLLGGFGDARSNYTTWQQHTALSIRADRIEYYRALVLWRMAISCVAALSFAGDERTMDTTVYTLLLPYLHYLLPQALEWAGCDDSIRREYAVAGAAAVAASPVLRDHAVALQPLELP